jgi:hypothetical protein
MLNQGEKKKREEGATLLILKHSLPVNGTPVCSNGGDLVSASSERSSALADAKSWCWAQPKSNSGFGLSAKQLVEKRQQRQGC